MQSAKIQRLPKTEKPKVHTTNRLIMLTIKVKSELNILASERKTAFTVLCLTRVLKTATRACIP